MKLFAILPAVLLLSAGCRSNRTASSASSGDDNGPEVTAVQFRDGHMRGGGGVNMLPRAVIYRTNGDYDDRVTVTLDATRTTLMSYPAPTDVNADSAPLVVADGWLLDRRGGIGPNTAFLDWSYAEYAAFPSVPSPADIMAHVIADARVTATRALPITASEALADTAVVNEFIRRNPK